MKRYFLTFFFILFFCGIIPVLNVHAESTENLIVAYDKAGTQKIEECAYTGEEVWFILKANEILLNNSLVDINWVISNSDKETLLKSDNTSAVPYTFTAEGKYSCELTIKLSIPNLSPQKIKFVKELNIYAPQPQSTSPKSNAVKLGNEASFEIIATGKDIQYDWRKAESETSPGVSVGEGNSQLKFTTEPSSSGYYYCVLTNNYGTYTTGRAKLTILCPIKYHANGGKGAPEEYSAEYNEKIELSNVVPEREGYWFKGWSLNKTAKYPSYASGDYYQVNTPVTMYAVWEKKPLKEQKVTSISSRKVVYGTKAFSLEAKTSGNGKLSYVSSNKKVACVSSNGKITIKGYGKTTITITAAKTNTYKKATKQITIAVVPKNVSLSKVVSPSKRTLSIVWKKNNTVSGYEVLISSDNNFKKDTYQRKFSKNVGNTKVSGLKSQKVFFVKIRAYKKSNGSTQYGAWSTIKKVKIK